MNRPEVFKGKWIVIGPPQNNSLISQLNGYVLAVYDDCIEVGYYQNDLKAIRDEVIWKSSHWEFKYQGPHGTYLSGKEELIVKNGPPHLSMGDLIREAEQSTK